MATNLFLGYCEIPLAAATTTLSVTADSTYGVNNLFGGNRADYFKVATAASGDTRLTFDVTAGKTATFLYLSKAITLQKDDVATITLKGHSANDYAAATTIATISSFGSATLLGPQSEDYITTFTETASHEWWFVNYNATATSYFQHSKLYIGKAFDPGHDPDENKTFTRIMTRGSQRKPYFIIELSWIGLTYAKAVAMKNTFVNNKRINGVILFTTSYHQVLNNYQAVLCRVTEFSSTPSAANTHDVKMTLEEMA